MKQQKLNEIRERCNAATPAPWTAILCEYECNCCPCPDDCEKEPSDCEKGAIICGAYVLETKTVDHGDYTDMSNADAEFIAHAREDVPALLDEVERLQSEKAALKSRLGNSLELPYYKK